MSKYLRRELDPDAVISTKRRARVVINYNDNFSPKKPKVQSTKRTATKSDTPSKPAIKKPTTEKEKPVKETKKPIEVEKDKPAKRSTKSVKKIIEESDSDADNGSEDEYEKPASSSSEEEEEETEESSEEDSAEEEDAYEETSRKSKPKTSPKTRKRAPKKNAPTTSTTKRKPLTPSNRAIHRVNQVMPVLPLRRVTPRDTSNLSQYALARERLHVSAVPDSLPCREEEFLTIKNYIESAIQEATGTCVYISGVPGTGKTATVLEVIRYLQHLAEQEEIPEFDFAEINGMKLTDPNQAYSILWECMDRANNNDGKKKRYTSAHALELLEAKFSSYNDDQKTT